MTDQKHSGNSSKPSSSVPSGGRELIVIASRAAGLRARADGVASVASADVTPLAALLGSMGATMKPLFGPSEEHLNLRAPVAGPDAPLDAPPMPQDLDLYYRVECPEARMDEMATKLRTLPIVEAAYVKPPASPAQEMLNTMLPRGEDVPPATPDFTARQGYLASAPDGVDAAYSWTLAGGRGAGVRVIDIEGAWRFTHEDLTGNQGGLVGGTESPDIGWRNHGTAVIGVIGGDQNNLGVTGISPDANVRAVSIFGGLGSAGAIRRAADLLDPGDIILIELHRPGPLSTGIGQQGFIALEWWPDDYDAIRYAISRGVIVVEAAGNGAQDLDAAAYDVPQPGFPASWSNPFRRGGRDSGAILVGAGAPPPGTHGRNHGPDRSRLDFSNFGASLDAQGWGREVTTCAYGDLQGGASEDAWYTDQFSGTSSASPIVVGSLACVQGIRRARGVPLLTPATARSLLRAKGSAQQDAPGRPATQRIGRRPDVRAMVAELGAPATVPLHRYWNPSIGDHFYTTNWNELGAGRHGWGYEGIQCYVFPVNGPGLAPLHRYWNPSIGDHFYTTNWSELGTGRHGWTYEGVQCYVHPGSGAAGTAPLYRYWNPSIGDHFYTTNWSELGTGRHGWTYEGVQCFVETHARLAVAAPQFLARAPISEAAPMFIAKPAFNPAPEMSSPTSLGNGAEASSTTSFSMSDSGSNPPVNGHRSVPPPSLGEMAGVLGSDSFHMRNQDAPETSSFRLATLASGESLTRRLPDVGLMSDGWRAGNVTVDVRFARPAP